MIIDARRANHHFERPPHVDLLTAEGLSNIEIDLGGEESDSPSLETLVFFLGTADVEDCFHRILIPDWLSDYFGLEPLYASEIGMNGKTVGGVVLGPDTAIYPCPRSMPTGFGWSLDFARD